MSKVVIKHWKPRVKLDCLQLQHTVHLLFTPSLNGIQQQLVGRCCSASQLSLNCRGQGQPSGLPRGQRSECIPPPLAPSPVCPFDLRCVELFLDWWEDGGNVLITPPVMDSFTGNDWVQEVHYGAEWGKNIFRMSWFSKVTVGYYSVLIRQLKEEKIIKLVFSINQIMFFFFTSPGPKKTGSWINI